MKRWMFVALVLGWGIDQFFKNWLFFSERVINDGVAFGWWSGWAWSGVGMVLILWLIYRFRWSWWLGWLVVGSASNLFDRLRVAGVIDYWNLWGLYFNLADVMIVVSAAGLIYSEVYGAKDTV